MANNNPTYLVTGGAGFIGCNLVCIAVEQGVNVVNFDRLTYAGHLESLRSVADSPRHAFVQGDLADRPLLSRLLHEHQVDAVIHLAAETHIDRSIDRPMPFAETNVLGTLQLLEASLEYFQSLSGDQRERFRLLHVSTDEVYGSLESGDTFSETSPYAPNSPYSASKASSDHLVRAYHHTYALPTLTTNVSNNYGPYQYPEKLIPTVILNALSGTPIPVYGSGEQVRDWLHVDDHCEAMLRVLDVGQPGEVYNIGGDCQQRNLDVVEQICAAVDRLATDLPRRPTCDLIEHVADRPGHDFRYGLDCTKIRTELDWQPRHSFAAGIEQTVRWYLDNLDWVRAIAGDTPWQHRIGLRWNESERSNDG